jgi:hypothetical protein
MIFDLVDRRGLRLRSPAEERRENETVLPASIVRFGGLYRPCGWFG